MADVLLRNLSEETLTAVDARASRLGISRNEYLRRMVARDVEPLAVDERDLAVFAERFADLGDTAVMSDAWD